MDYDATLARRLVLVDQLQMAYGFSDSAIHEALQNLGDDASVESIVAYILDEGLAKDDGGPIVPQDSCMHTKNMNNLVTLGQLPLVSCQVIPCQYHQVQHSTEPRLKDDLNGACPAGTAENWLCFTCGHVYCSRYQQGHALQHFQATNHTLHLSLRDGSVWCHGCQCYLNAAKVPALDAIVQQVYQRNEAAGAS